MTGNEEFWRGRFGDEYNRRNVGMVQSNTVFFARALCAAMHGDPSTVLELGCGTGQNLEALVKIFREARLDGVEINADAAASAQTAVGQRGQIWHGSIESFARHADEQQWDVVFTKGVLIHQPHEDLVDVYAAMHRLSKRYILVAEYYNPIPVEIEYRGHRGVLWKRDFAGELLDGYSDLRLVDCGFTYHRGPYPQDDITWFLLEKGAR